MEILSVIMSGLALLAAMASFTLWMFEKKRSQKQRDAILQLIALEGKTAVAKADENAVVIAAEHARAATEEACKYTDKEVKKANRNIDGLNKKLSETAGDMEAVKKNVTDLMNGVVPEYEEAVKAKEAVNSFSRDIAAILNFDPVQAARETRLRNRSGQEVE